MALDPRAAAAQVIGDVLTGRSLSQALAPRLEQVAASHNVPFLRAQPQHTGDNAGMIAFAAWVEREVGQDPAAQVNRAFEIAFLRKATDAERAEVLPVVTASGLRTLCRVLLNSNEFLHLP